MIGGFLVAWVTSQAAITALIGAGAAMRFWPAGAVPQTERESFPRVMFQKIGGDDFTGELTRPGLTWEATYQLTLVDRGKQAVGRLETLANLFIGTQAAPKLHYYSGTLGGVTVSWARLTNETDSPSAPDDGSDDTIHERALDFSFQYSRE